MNISTAELSEIIGATRRPTEHERISIDPQPLGQNIVVLDRGFVYVGDVSELPDRIYIKNAKNIRVWGTSNGLGELRNGPLSNTKLDTVGEVTVYRNAVMHLIPCKGF